MVLPLRVWLDEQNSDNAQLAHTVDISPGGGRLGGLRIQVEPGQAILIQRGQQKAQFRVVWAKQMGPGEIQAGVESVDPEKKIWGVELTEPPNSGAEPRASKGGLARGRAKGAGLAWFRAVASLDSQIRWGAALGVLLIAFASVVFIERNPDGNKTSVISGVSPAAQPLELITVPHAHTNQRVFTFLNDEKSEADDAAERLQVSEAPQGHIFYPVSPDSELSGEVELKIVIATDGRVRQVEVLSGKQVLAEAAVRAARFWRYARHDSNGHPVEAETSASVQFRAGDAVSVHFPTGPARESRASATPTKYTPQ